MQTNPPNLQALPFLQRRSVKIIGGVVVATFLIVLAIPFLVNADNFRPQVQTELSSALGRQVTLGHLGFSLVSGSLVANDIAIADDPAFSTSPFFAARSLHIGVSVGELLFRRRLRVASLTADSPEIHLIAGKNSTWNYSSLGGGASSSSTSSSRSEAPDLSIGELKIVNGSVSVASLATSAKPFVYDKVDLSVKHLSLTTPMPFELTADLPGGGSLKLSGSAGPIAQPNAVDTPVQATLTVKHFNPVAAGVIAADEGIAMVADIDGKAASDGKTVTISGKVQASGLKLSPHGTPTPQPVNVDFAVTDNLGTDAGQVSDLAVHTGALVAHVTGTYQMDGPEVTLALHLAAPSLPIDGLEQLLPAIGIRLPSGSSLRGGTVSADFAITGSAASPKIAGPIEVDNTELAGFDLSSKMEGFMKPGGSPASSGTVIRRVRADVTHTPQSTQLANITAEVPSIGSASGNGTVAASGALDFQMVAKLGATSAMTSSGASLLAVAGKFLSSASGGGIPLSITGTTSSPSIRLDTSAMLKQQTGGFLKGASGAKSGLSGLTKSLTGR